MSIQNNNIDISSITGFSPSFTWQVGINNPSLSANSLTFRATIRPLNGLEQYTRIPSSGILYEETGILINSVTQLGQWTFPLSTNINLTGGPYRDYQVVIEGHDNNGLTSAGNLVGLFNNENGWTQFNQGYDIIAISNPRQTGIELKNNIPTQEFSTGSFNSVVNNYNNYAYLGPNGDVTISFTSGYFNPNLVGGYLYVSSGQFPKYETLIRSGIWGTNIKRTRFDFNPLNPNIYAPLAGSNLIGATSGIIGVSFYDSLDNAFLQKGIDISTGLYLSNNAVIFKDTSVGKLILAGDAGMGVTIKALTYSGDYPFGGGGSVDYDWTNSAILASGTANGITSVIYMFPDSGSSVRW